MNYSWQDELKSSLKSIREINSFLKGSPIFNDYLNKVKDFDESRYPVFIPERIMQRIKNQGPSSPTSLQFLPNIDELENQEGHYDPIGDRIKKVAPQLIHRYKNRALFLPTAKCPINCRYCFRKNEIHEKDPLFNRDLSSTLDYLKAHPEIDEIIFSGGDPFILTDTQILSHIENFSKISHIKKIRFHTRFPIILPSRFNGSLLESLSSNDRFKFIFVIHVNHVDEIKTDESIALQKISNKFTTLSQSVLMKSINDKPIVLKELYEKLFELNVIAYYLHCTDDVIGTRSFQLEPKLATDCYRSFRSLVSGYLHPKLILDSFTAVGKEVIGSMEYAKF